MKGVKNTKTSTFLLFLPTHTGAYVDYAKSYCWIKNTYYIPMDDQIPIEHASRESEELTYYQWVPLILLFQVSFTISQFIYSEIISA